MRRISIVALTCGAALAAAGVAVAVKTSTGTNLVASSFTATTVERYSSRTCTGPDGQYEVVDATYSGNATSSEPGLAGTARVRIRSAYNTTKNVGWASGSLSFSNGGDRGALGFDAVNASGKLTGFVRGRVGQPAAELLGSFSADYSKSGLQNGQIGGGGSAPNVAVLATKLCRGGPPNKSVKLTVKGVVDTLAADSITVKPNDGSTSQTCAIRPGSPSTAHVAKGDHVEMTCQTIGGTLTLVRLKKRG
jgi:hypothetical protein